MFAGTRPAVRRAAMVSPLTRAIVRFPARNLTLSSPKTVARLPLTTNLTKQWIQAARSYSVLSQNEAKQYKYEDIKKIAGSGSQNKVLLVDVREPVEFQDGHIPGAVNVPFKSSPGAFDLSEDEFEESFGFPKPDKSQELVFYCLGGVRSTAAEELANSFGYTKRGNYVGSWEDWVTQENARKAN